MLEKKEIKPGSKRADEFMEEWDRKQAEKLYKEAKEKQENEKQRQKEAEQAAAERARIRGMTQDKKTAQEVKLKEYIIQKEGEKAGKLKEIEESRNPEGEKSSRYEKFNSLRDFYLDELGYHLERKGLLWWEKVRVLDKNGNFMKEFKMFKFKKNQEWNETPLLNFLNEKWQEKNRKEAAEKVGGGNE